VGASQDDLYGTNTNFGSAYVFGQNGAPTDISLDNSTIFDREPAGRLVGLFSTTDPNDPGDSHRYQLISGPGDTDNSLFDIPAGTNELQTGAVFDYETQSIYSIRVETTDQGSLTWWISATWVVIGTPDTFTWSMRSRACRTVASGGSVAGLMMMPLALRLTLSTSFVWASIDMFL